jgi:nucleotide-binding universal stress UspA family protein
MSRLCSRRCVWSARWVHRVAEPARIIAALQVIEPRVLVYAVCQLREDRQILRLEVLPPAGTAKVEAVVAHVAFGVLPQVALALGTGGQHVHGERRLVHAREPRNGLPCSRSKSLRPRQRVPGRIREALQGDTAQLIQINSPRRCAPTLGGSAKEKPMFKHILVAIDGSEVSRHAAQAAAELARLGHGRITAVHVAPAYKPDIREEQGVGPDFVTPDEHAKRERQRAQPFLNYVADAAGAAGVASDGTCVLSNDPASAIIDTAARHGCDTIVMGSHGHKGIKRMLLGSVAQKVLVDTTIPVLVTR